MKWAVHPDPSTRRRLPESEEASACRRSIGQAWRCPRPVDRRTGEARSGPSSGAPSAAAAWTPATPPSPRGSGASPLRRLAGSSRPSAGSSAGRFPRVLGGWRARGLRWPRLGHLTATATGASADLCALRAPRWPPSSSTTAAKVRKRRSSLRSSARHTQT